MALYPCSVDIEVERPEGEIPHYLPGTNPFLEQFAAKWALPLEAVRGGAETMYPEFMERLKNDDACPKATPPRQQPEDGATSPTACRATGSMSGTRDSGLGTRSEKRC